MVKNLCNAFVNVKQALVAAGVLAAMIPKRIEQFPDAVGCNWAAALAG
jgi:hypothetical protein